MGIIRKTQKNRGLFVAVAKRSDICCDTTPHHLPELKRSKKIPDRTSKSLAGGNREKAPPHWRLRLSQPRRRGKVDWEPLFAGPSLTGSATNAPLPSFSTSISTKSDDEQLLAGFFSSSFSRLTGLLVRQMGSETELHPGRKKMQGGNKSVSSYSFNREDVQLDELRATTSWGHARSRFRPLPNAFLMPSSNSTTPYLRYLR